MGDRKSGSWARNGCLTLLALGAVVAIVLGVVSGVALRQNRNASFEQQTFEHSIADPTTAVAELTGLVRLRLELHTAAVSVKPGAAGQPLRIEADYDPRQYVLRQESEHAAGADVLTVELRPLGSEMMALLRVKLGGRPPMLRITLPRGIPLEIEGSLSRTYAAMELGGLSLASTDVMFVDGGVKVSFREPLAAPMERIRINGHRGSLSIVSLGNASPKDARLFQHVGAVDLDLRGAWSRDARLSIVAGAAGGSLWLPDNVTLQGLDEHRGVGLSGDAETQRPTLDVSLRARMGRLVVVD